jgi:glycosidase
MAQMIINRKTTGQYANTEKFDYDETGNSARNNSGYLLRAPNPEERSIQRLIMLFQMTYVGAPMFYYGVEAGMWGGDDPDCRKPMPWDDLKMDAEKIDPRGRTRPEDNPNVDQVLHAFVREALAMHAANAAFKTSDFKVLVADDEKNVFIYSRGTGEDLRVVALNRSGQAQTVKFKTPTGEVIFSTIGGKDVRLAKDGDEIELTLPAVTGAVLK